MHRKRLVSGQCSIKGPRCRSNSSRPDLAPSRVVVAWSPGALAAKPSEGVFVVPVLAVVFVVVVAGSGNFLSEFDAVRAPGPCS